MKKIIFAATLILLLIFGTSSGLFKVSNKDAVFSRSKLMAALSPALIKSLQEQIALILAKIKELQEQLNDLIQKEKSDLAATTTKTTVIASTTTEAIAIPKLIVKDLNFKVDFPILQLRNYLDFTLFDFTVESKENIAITRLRFKQTGTLADHLIDNFRLVDASSGSEVLLAKFGNPVDGIIDFVMVPDKNKINKGLVVPGRRYKVVSTITVYYGIIRPTVSLELKASSDVSAFDSNDLSRQAELPEAIFPVGGPIYTISRN